MKKQQTSKSKAEETTTPSKRKDDIEYKLWLKINNPFIYKMKYGGNNHE
tara:strand:+ start:1335 stop:1481 length:147 start_codon:yes stop_codon:yes gene_type:complete